ncbi:MAG: hypothetical protein JWP06_1198 [Candidatus Saccharibacteria bacterium]|nr:hypothetical protein [Candidatus Saccharibacteria bacterium]
MQHDLSPISKQPTDNSDTGQTTAPAPSHELEHAPTLTPEVLEEKDNREIESIVQLLLERGESVIPGTQIIESLSDDDKVYDVTHFYGVETRLPAGVARFTVRAWRSMFNDEYRARITAMREKSGLSPDSHEAFFAEQNTTGFLVISSWNDEVDGKPRKVEETLNYMLPSNRNIEVVMRTKSGVIPPGVPEALISPFVTPIKLTGEPIPLEAAQSEGNATREAFRDTPDDDTLLARTLGKLGIRRKS